MWDFKIILHRSLLQGLGFTFYFCAASDILFFFSFCTSPYFKAYLCAAADILSPASVNGGIPLRPVLPVEFLEGTHFSRVFLFCRVCRVSFCSQYTRALTFGNLCQVSGSSAHDVASFVCIFSRAARMGHRDELLQDKGKKEKNAQP